MSISEAPSKRGPEGNLSVLGSTGSIGQQTLEVVRRNPGRFKVSVLAAASDVETIVRQAREFEPEFVALCDERAAEDAARKLGGSFVVEGGEAAVVKAASFSAVHTVVAAIVGFSSLRPVLAALSSDKNIALANKECLVAAGSLVMKAVEESRGRLAPVDSEHSSIFQCLLGRGNTKALRKVVLTASGGPFLKSSLSELQSVRPEDAVRHPRWNMGPKISVDSATLMNKGLEVIEASVLFDLPPEKVEVLVHPQSIVHGFAEYIDGTMLAALYQTDMRVPIAFALNYLYCNDEFISDTQAVASGADFLDLSAHGRLDFEAPDCNRFPALRLAYEALRRGGSAPTILNAANEIAVTAFLGGEIGFVDIPRVVEQVLEAAEFTELCSLDDVYDADAWARDRALRQIAQPGISNGCAQMSQTFDK